MIPPNILKELCTGSATTKYRENRNGTITVFTTNPNGCGYVGPNNILVGEMTISKSGDVFGKSTKRIPLSEWNSLEYVECCAKFME